MLRRNLSYQFGDPKSDFGVCWLEY